MMSAYIIAIGKFDQAIASQLDYPNEYQGMSREDYVTSVLFPCRNAAESCALADALEIDPWRFEQHFLGKAPEVVWTRLHDVAAQIGLPDDIDRFRALWARDFTFIFIPTIRQRARQNVVAAEALSS